jgi:hypothetical protein
MMNRRTFVVAAMGALPLSPARGKTLNSNRYIVDDLSQPAPRATDGANWSLVSDRVMGGISNGVMSREIVAGRAAIRMRGDVSLENNGGFLQIGIDLNPDGRIFDASDWKGLEVDVFGNGENYNAHLRTTDLTRPWQSYRFTFMGEPRWQSVRMPFGRFKPYRTDVPLKLKRLRRLGLVAIGRQFKADLAIGGVRYYQ